MVPETDLDDQLTSKLATTTIKEEEMGIDQINFSSSNTKLYFSTSIHRSHKSNCPYICNTHYSQVTITDINDNCPVISPTSAEMTPLPVLVNDPLMYFTNSDADSDDNGDVRYIVTEVIAE